MSFPLRNKHIPTSISPPAPILPWIAYSRFQFPGPCSVQQLHKNTFYIVLLEVTPQAINPALSAQDHPTPTQLEYSVQGKGIL